MKKIIIGISVAIAAAIIIISLSMGNSTPNQTNPNLSPTKETFPSTTTPGNVTLPSTTPRHFDISLDERMKFKT